MHAGPGFHCRSIGTHVLKITQYGTVSISKVIVQKLFLLTVALDQDQQIYWFIIIITLSGMA